MNYLHRDSLEDGDRIWKFKQILAHSGPLTHRHPSYKGCSYNLLIEWETGEQTEEPLSNMIADDPVSVALYAKKNNLLDTQGWKQLRRLARKDKQLQRLINQAKLRSFQTTPKYKYGF